MSTFRAAPFSATEFVNASATSRPSPRAHLKLGIAPFAYDDLFEPKQLAALHKAWEEAFRDEEPEAFITFEAYRVARGERYSEERVSNALLAAAPSIGRFIARLFNIEKEAEVFRSDVASRAPIWRFRREFVKKRVHKEAASAAANVFEADVAHHVVRALCIQLGRSLAVAADDEELQLSLAGLRVLAIVDVAHKAAKGGGAHWTAEARTEADRIVAITHDYRRAPDTVGVAAGDTTATNSGEPDADIVRASAAEFALAALESDLRRRMRDRRDPASTWALLKAPKQLDYSHLVHLRRPDPKLPEMFVGPEGSVRYREGFALTDPRGDARIAEQEIDYCLYCHERNKDSCSKGLRDAKTHELKKNPLGVSLTGCPLGEKISEMHVMRREGDPLAALALVTLDNPMCPGTGHRICNDCMKGCVFQKQEPVNIPQVETRVLSEVLALPYGAEIYGLLTRWNPLNIERPYALPYNGKQVLVVGLGPAGYTLSHYLSREGFGVVAVDGLKLEPLASELTGRGAPRTPVHDASTLWQLLDERVVLGFGGVSEYGITVRWDKNFLALVYLTLSRNPLLTMIGGVRFGGAITLEDAFELGFDHVAIATGAGKPTIIEMKNNLARGIRKASDLLMGLQLSGAYKKSSISNLQISLPAIVIGGGLTAIDTATELAAYYPIQIEKTRERYDILVRERGIDAVRKQFDDEERGVLDVHLEHARELLTERETAAREGRDPNLAALIDKWGGVTLAYRKGLVDSPAYRLNHEEVEKSLEEGIRYAEHLSPVAAELDQFGSVQGLEFARADGTRITLPARTVCVAAGTSPNVTYEREYPGTFALDARRQYFLAHAAKRDAGGALELVPQKGGFFTSFTRNGKCVSFYGDNHPTYAGSVVRAMASAKDGYRHVTELFPEIAGDVLAHSSANEQAEREARHREFHGTIHGLLSAEVVEVIRLTATIVEVVVRAPLAARKFQPGQFYRLQNFETYAPIVDGTRLAIEGLALTGAWTDPDKGLLGTIVLEMGGSANLCAGLRPGEPVVLMGPTGAPTEIAANETVLLCGGGLGNAVLFSIARAFKAMGAKVLYFAGYKKGEDLFKQDDIEAFTDQVIWTTDSGVTIPPRRVQDAHFRGNIVQAMAAFARGELGEKKAELRDVSRIIAIGSDRMMAAVKDARHGILLPFLNPRHLAIGSINSPMQCMMKEVCAQCLQKHRMPDGTETMVFSCFNQDQDLDTVDFDHLRARLRVNSVQEKLTVLWLQRLAALAPAPFGLLGAAE